ncbi:glycoside hydrolase family 2 TIM barrel-domain containing protein [Streptomyces sp. NPDC005248]|uniref:glycoside hydrolase family 2 TIM barrel-domain containing protein n=1 Tax=Streptomyces sp. NPDC005248 TaxID=3364709 RepID=UPI0036D03456
MTHGTARHAILLDGVWDVADSTSATERPTAYAHRVPVPALTHSSTPEFPGIDEFETPEYEVVKGLVGRPSDPFRFTDAGTPGHSRNYFWYRTTFEAPSPRNVATLRVSKAQFGSEVWVNGTSVGGNDSGFTAANYDITSAVRWSAENEVVIRIGAHPGVLPPGNTAVVDFEKTHWTAGVWDAVSVFFNDGVSITSTQVAPRIDPQQITVQTQLTNTTSKSVTVTLVQAVREWRGSEVMARAEQDVTLEAGGSRTVTETIPLPDARLWSQESPNLYVLDTSTGGDSTSTRFGVREFRFDAATKRAYLNGEVIFLRGATVCLHRFFDDEKAGTLPWQEDWVRELLGPIPRRMHCNTLKFTIGPVPERWLEIADEEGLLVFYEFPVWTLMPEVTQGWRKEFDTDTLRREYEAWLSDNWNHPSIVYWSASLESKLPPEQSNDIIEAVRKLDLSDRPWGNSWNPPQGPDDPHEYKQYVSNDPKFDMLQLEFGSGARRAPYDPPTGHPALITEFDWIWLTRDGGPTPYTKDLWAKTAYPHETADERFRTQAYVLAGQIEYWRAYRNYAGVLYLSYLSAGWVVDNFRDVENLTFQPYYEEYVANAFKPLGVYINFWQRELEVDSSRVFDISLVNDAKDRATGTITLTVENEDGRALASSSRRYDVVANGQMTYPVSIDLPSDKGSVVLKATARSANAPSEDHQTVSRRFVTLLPEGALAGMTRSILPGDIPDAGGQFEAGA